MIYLTISSNVDIEWVKSILNNPSLRNIKIKNLVNTKDTLIEIEYDKGKYTFNNIVDASLSLEENAKCVNTNINKYLSLEKAILYVPLNRKIKTEDLKFVQIVLDFLYNNNIFCSVVYRAASSNWVLQIPPNISLNGISLIYQYIKNNS